ncbi:MAG: type IV pilin N-terminal domain-containing protein [Methanocorpusculum sp.]|nr:type IV pilin N-terminal domain-containing protein [Methanocorpusculum sp.]
MKQKHTSKKEDAVSPIVGVMLMLVATIIVAAIVAAFAGGLAAETDASPNIIISGTYSQTDGLLLKHLSGDSVSGVDIYVRPDQGFSTSYHKLSWKADSISESSVWNAGDTREVSASKIQPMTNGAPNSGTNHDGSSSSYGFNYQKSIGKTMIVELHKDGRIIASTPVKIMA